MWAPSSVCTPVKKKTACLKSMKVVLFVLVLNGFYLCDCRMRGHSLLACYPQNIRSSLAKCAACCLRQCCLLRCVSFLFCRCSCQRVTVAVLSESVFSCRLPPCLFGMCSAPPGAIILERLGRGVMCFSRPSSVSP